MKNKFTIALLAAGLIAVTGCTSLINTPQGKIVSITQRGIGLLIDYQPQSSTPEIKFGFFSSAVVFIPTSTNSEGTVVSPNFANTFDYSQSSAFALGIGENIASGNYETLMPGQTNSAVATEPIVPK